MVINNSKILNALDLEKQNPGSSTGKNWFHSSSSINSISPINGSRIGSVTETSQKEYEKIILVAKKAFIDFRKINFIISWILRLISKSYFIDWNKFIN